MTYVRFATLCSHCGRRSEEYSAFLSCRECGDDVCPDCSTRYDADPPGSAVCKECDPPLVAICRDVLLAPWGGIAP
jgi:hypothetical protein